MAANYSLARDLHELAGMGASLGAYLPGSELYMRVGAGNMPPLTVGAFLLRLRRLGHFRGRMNLSQQAALDKARAQHDARRQEWSLHYEKKLKREVASRLRAMRAFFDECAESMRGCAAAYPAEAMRRTLAQEILIAMDGLGYDKGDLMPAVHQSDRALRRYVRVGAFIWSPKLEAVYPRHPFWWLYARPDATFDPKSAPADAG